MSSGHGSRVSAETPEVLWRLPALKAGGICPLSKLSPGVRQMCGVPGIGRSSGYYVRCRNRLPAFTVSWCTLTWRPLSPGCFVSRRPSSSCTAYKLLCPGDSLCLSRRGRRSCPGSLRLHPAIVSWCLCLPVDCGCGIRALQPHIRLLFGTCIAPQRRYPPKTNKEARLTRRYGVCNLGESSKGHGMIACLYSWTHRQRFLAMKNDIPNMVFLILG